MALRRTRTRHRHPEVTFQGCQKTASVIHDDPRVTWRFLPASHRASGEVPHPLSSRSPIAAASPERLRWPNLTPWRREAGRVAGRRWRDAPPENVLRRPLPHQRVAACCWRWADGVNLMPACCRCVAQGLSLSDSGPRRRPRARQRALVTAECFRLRCPGRHSDWIARRRPALGWGFQLQQPLVIGALVYLMFAVGLSLSGVFALGHRFAGAGHELTGRSGPLGDFFTGVLAVVIASPCTAPFMGAALAFAFTASTAVALLVFAFLGLGLALPFLLIGFVPGLAQRLPRPGAWMETLKHFLAFPMYMTAAWLWVLASNAAWMRSAWRWPAVVLALGLGVPALRLRWRRCDARWRSWSACLAGAHGLGACTATRLAAPSPGELVPYRPPPCGLPCRGRVVFVA